jgi:hypothetical protein
VNNADFGDQRYAKRPANRLLAALSREVFDRIRPHLYTIPTKTQQVFHRQGAPVEHVYFLNGGVGSITTVLEDGTTVEAATVGDEGFLRHGGVFQRKRDLDWRNSHAGA